MTLERAPHRAGARIALLALFLSACSAKTLDAGFDDAEPLLPVDAKNPVILSNDGTGYWYGLYSILFASTGGPALAGIAVNSSAYATNLGDNLSDWQALVTAARASGLHGIPDPIASNGAPLARPAGGDIDATTANGSEGAHLIVDASRTLAEPQRPVVVAAGGRLTDVADAYLLDHTVQDRIVVVAALGTGSTRGGVMAAPNGELDPWADWIVAQRLRYVQVSAYYDATLDLPPDALADLPANSLGTLIAEQQPNITNTVTRTDQVSVLAASLPKFVTAVERVVPDPAATFDASKGPPLVPNKDGPHWMVVGIDAHAAGERLRELLADPATFGG